MADQNREPKGTSTGGQFAASSNPEATALILEGADGTGVTVAVSRQIDLTEPFSIEDARSQIALLNSEVEEVYELKASREDGGGDTLDELIDEGELLVVLKNSIIRKQDEIIAAQQRELVRVRASQSSFDLEGSMAGRICERIGPLYDDSHQYNEAVEKVRAVIGDWSPDYETFDDAIGDEASEVMREKRDELVAIFGEFDW